MLNLDTYFNQICSVTWIYITGLVQSIVSFPLCVTCIYTLCIFQYVQVETAPQFAIHAFAYTVTHSKANGKLWGSTLCYFYFGFLGKHHPDQKIWFGFVLNT